MNVAQTVFKNQFLSTATGAAAVITSQAVRMDGNAAVLIVTLIRLEQKENAAPPTLVTLPGMDTIVRLVHPENAPDPIVVTLPGIVMLARLLQE